jgi:hypothetical protein
LMRERENARERVRERKEEMMEGVGVRGIA